MHAALLQENVQDGNPEKQLTCDDKKSIMYMLYSDYTSNKSNFTLTYFKSCKPSTSHVFCSGDIRANTVPDIISCRPGHNKTITKPCNCEANVC